MISFLSGLEHNTEDSLIVLFGNKLAFVTTSFPSEFLDRRKVIKNKVSRSQSGDRQQNLSCRRGGEGHSSSRLTVIMTPPLFHIVFLTHSSSLFVW